MGLWVYESRILNNVIFDDNKNLCAICQFHVYWFRLACILNMRISKKIFPQLEPEMKKFFFILRHRFASSLSLYTSTKNFWNMRFAMISFVFEISHLFQRGSIWESPTKLPFKIRGMFQIQTSHFWYLGSTKRSGLVDVPCNLSIKGKFPQKSSYPFLKFFNLLVIVKQKSTKPAVRAFITWSSMGKIRPSFILS